MVTNLEEQYGELAADVSRILYTAEDIQNRVAEIGLAISDDYAGKNPLMVGVLKGIVFFMSDLLRVINIPLEVDFIAVSSYSPETRGKGLVRMVKDLEIPVAERHIIFVEDVVDTGLTLNYILRNLKARQPASLEVCALFDKAERRLINVPIKYKGFDLPDQFVVGYGLDHREKYRNLPFVGLLKPEMLKGSK